MRREEKRREEKRRVDSNYELQKLQMKRKCTLLHCFLQSKDNHGAFHA